MGYKPDSFNYAKDDFFRLNEEGYRDNAAKIFAGDFAEGIIDEETGGQVTVNDFWNLPASLNFDDIQRFMATRLGFAYDRLLRQKFRSPEYYVKFNEYWRDAKRLYTSTENGFGSYLPPEIADFKIRSKEDVEKLIKMVRPTTRGHLMEGMIVCALLKIANAYIEYNNNNLAELQKVMDETFQKLVRDALELKEKPEWGERMYEMPYGDNGQTVRCEYYSRAKQFFSCILKMLRDPKYGGKQLPKDLLAHTIRVDSEEKGEKERQKEMAGVVYTSIMRLHRKDTRQEMKLENMGLLDQKEFESLVERLKQSGVKLEYSITKTTDNGGRSSDNSDSGSRYRAIHLTTGMRTTRGNPRTEREFEVKFLWEDPDDHPAYRARQILSVMTRFFGFFTQDALDQVAQMYSQKATMDVQEFKEKELLPYLIKIGEKSGKTLYSHKYQFLRLIRTPQFPPEWREALLVNAEVQKVLNEKKAV